MPLDFPIKVKLKLKAYNNDKKMDVNVNDYII